MILVLAGLGGYIYWVEYPAAQKEAEKTKLFDFRAEDATELSLTYADREIVLTKTGDAWRLTKPMETSADAVTTKSILSAIADCEIKKELTDASTDLALYGLDKPFVSVTVKVKDKELPAVAVGKTTPIGFSAYLQRADDKKILLANGAFRSSLDKQVKDFRDKTIVSFADEDLQRVAIEGDGQEIILTKPDGTWTIEQPGPYRADASSVRSLLSSLRAMRATDFPDDAPTDLSAYGLDAPRLSIRLTSGKEPRETIIRFGNKENDKKEPYVQTSGQTTVYTVSEHSLKELSKRPNDLRDKALLAFARDDAVAVEVQHKDGEPFKLVRGDDKQWRVEGVEGKPAVSLANQYIGDIHDLKGYEIVADNPVDLAEHGLDQPLLRVRVLGAEQKDIGTIKIAERPSADGKKELTAIAEGGQTVFLVRDYSVTRLNKHAKDFIEAPTPTPGGATPTIASDEIPEMGFGDEEFGADE